VGLSIVAEKPVSWFHWGGAGEEEPWRKLIKNTSVEALDQDSGELVNIKPIQDDANDIEGLLVGFDYTDAAGNRTRRIVLCWRCWNANECIYVQGYCTTREALRTFRVDHMRAVKEVRTKRDVADPLHYFSRFIRSTSQDRAERWIDGIASEFSNFDVDKWTVYRQRLQRAREACIDGLRVLAYLALADDIVTDEEKNVEQSYIEARLAMCGFDHDQKILEDMMAFVRALTVPSRSFSRSLAIVSKDAEYFRLVMDSAIRLAETSPSLGRIERNALTKILETARGLNSTH
jgi:hypothetical protein